MGDFATSVQQKSTETRYADHLDVAHGLFPVDSNLVTRRQIVRDEIKQLLSDAESHGGEPAVRLTTLEKAKDVIMKKFALEYQVMRESDAPAPRALDEAENKALSLLDGGALRHLPYLERFTMQKAVSTRASDLRNTEAANQAVKAQKITEQVVIEHDALAADALRQSELTGAPAVPRLKTAHKKSTELLRSMAASSGLSEGNIDKIQSLLDDKSGRLQAEEQENAPQISRYSTGSIFAQQS